MLEARDRLGGRAFLKTFCGNGPRLEYGGAWITPWQHRIRSLVEEHGLSLRPRHSVTTRYWLRDGGLFASGPTSDQQRAAHERVLARVASDSMLVKLGRMEDEIGRPLTPLSFSKYLDRLNPPDATRHLCSRPGGQFRATAIPIRSPPVNFWEAVAMAMALPKG